ncbi:MAG: BACON domain-containing carbohydrate-binding protein, partial [Candidatus Solibacter sp.]|nr:BACON domain-containing carbohydrate-binding protein [Candidatus Solibacter sp.]
ATFANGSVGVPYSATFTPSAGTGPYTFAPATGTNLPGLSLSPGGILSGTPNSAGLFFVTVTVTDSVANTLTISRGLVIDNAGQAQGIGMPPTIQLNYVLTAPAPAPVPINVTATSGSIPFTAAVEGIPGATLTPAVGNAPAGLNLNLNTAGLAAGTFAGVVAVNSPQSANGFTYSPIVLTVTPPPPCSYSLNPTAGSIAATGGTNSFSVSVGSLCAWTPVASDPAWITITSGAGPGSGTVGYTVAANPPGQPARTGSITAGGQTYTITQFGSVCTFAVSPPSVSEPAAGGQITVNVLSSLGGCPWTASGLGATPVSGAGNGSVTVTIPVNILNAPVVYTASIAGQTLTVNQAAANAVPPPCAYSLSPGAGGAPAVGGNGGFSVAVGPTCAWTPATPNPTWITVTAGAGPGPGAVSYSVAQNPPGQPARTGSITVADQTYTITQFGSTCSFSISPGSTTATSGGGTATVNITSSVAGCPWTASGLSAAPASGAGSGSVTLTIPANNLPATQTLHATVAGQDFAVTQSGINCTVALDSSSISMGSAGGTGSVNVTTPAGCAYNTVAGPGWIPITSGGSGAGPGPVTLSFSVAANSTTTGRSGTFSVGGQPFQVNQDPTPCSVTVGASTLAKHQAEPRGRRLPRLRARATRR